MNKLKLTLMVFIALVALLLVSCDDSTGTTGQTNGKSISITSPGAGTSVKLGENVTVKATVGQAGAIVSCWSSDLPVGIDTAAPYEFQVPAMTVGTDTIEVVAAWPDGSEATDTVLVTVTEEGGDTKFFSITSPQEGATFTAGDMQRISLQLQGEPTKLTYWQDGILRTTDEEAPFELFFTAPAFGDKSTIVVAATWDDGTVISDTVNVVVTGGTTPPVKITWPESGESFSAGDELFVTADLLGTPTLVKCFFDAVLVASVDAAPYEMSFISPNVSGTYNLVVTGYWDDGTEASDTVVVTLTGGQKAITITNPLDGAVIAPGTTQLLKYTTAGFVDGVDGIFATLNGEKIPGTITPAMGITGIDIGTSFAPEGTHTIILSLGENENLIDAADTVTFTIGTGTGDPEIFFQNVAAEDTIILGQYDYELGVKIKNYDREKHSVTATLNGVSVVETHMQPVSDTGGTSFYGLDTLYPGTYEIVVSLLEGATLLGADTLNLTVADSILWQTITPDEGMTLSLDSAVTISAAVAGEIASMVLYLDGEVIGTQSADFSSSPYWENFKFEYIEIEKFSLGAKVLTFEATTKSGNTFTKNVNVTCVVNAPEIRCYAIKTIGQDVFYYHDTIDLDYLIDNFGPFPGYECEVYIHETIKVPGSKIVKGIDMPDMKNFKKPGLYYGEGVHEMVWIVTAPSGFVTSRDTVTFEVVKE